MGRFGAAAILAALCSQLCLYGSGNSVGDFQHAARSNQEEGLGTEAEWRSGQRRSLCYGGVHLLDRLEQTFGTRTLRSSSCRYGQVTRSAGTRVHLLTAGLWGFIEGASVSNGATHVRSGQRVISKEEWAHLRVLSPSQTRRYGNHGSRPTASRSIPSVGSIRSDLITECVNQLVKTFCRELCSTWAWSRITRHIRAPLSLHYLCDSGRAAVMSCWDGQPGSARTLSELPLQHSCITGGHRSRGKSIPNTNLLPHPLFYQCPKPTSRAESQHAP
jgi:hypothetical protein